jgi:tetratricopeptide (TPR) repeat protein
MKRPIHIPALAALLLVGGFFLLRKWGASDAHQPQAAAEVGILSSNENARINPSDSLQSAPQNIDSQVVESNKSNIPIIAEQVLKNLYTTYGDRQRPCPKLLFTDDNQGPRYRESAQTIVLDERSIEVCRSFGRDSVSALAFIIGHELAHFFHSKHHDHKAEYSYLAFDRGRHGNTEQERLADVQGIFNAYLAGYRTTAILPKVIAKLYESYQLKSKLDGYPSLSERQRTSAAVLATVDTLTQLYETANFLTALGLYELAAASYQYILRYYPGREVYNNLGACHALHAMFCSAKSSDAFQYPLEIDTDSRLTRPRARGGESELTDSERAMRKELLLEAEKALKTAGRLDPSYFPVDVNLLCVLALQGKSGEAIRHWEKHKMAANKGVSVTQKNRARLALGIALAQTDEAGGREQAERIFQSIVAQKADPALASMATYNLKALQNGLDEKPAAAPAFDCIKPFELEKVDGVSIHRISLEGQTALPGTAQLSFGLKKMASSTLLQFQQSGRPVLNFQRVLGGRKAQAPALTGKRPQLVQAATGFFLICGEEHAAFLFDGRNRLAEWGRFYMFETK